MRYLPRCRLWCWRWSVGICLSFRVDGTSLSCIFRKIRTLHQLHLHSNQRVTKLRYSPSRNRKVWISCYEAICFQLWCLCALSEATSYASPAALCTHPSLCAQLIVHLDLCLRISRSNRIECLQCKAHSQYLSNVFQAMFAWSVPHKLWQYFHDGWPISTLASHLWSIIFALQSMHWST